MTSMVWCVQVTVRLYIEILTTVMIMGINNTVTVTVTVTVTMTVQCSLARCTAKV
jgi:hypothetical protein